MGDETWVYGFDVETEAQSWPWVSNTSPRPKTSTASSAQNESDFFFYCEGAIQHEFLPRDQTVNREYCLTVTKRLTEAMGTRSSDLWKGKEWLLHHDNPPAHSSLLICDFLTTHETTLFPQPPYSPELTPADFFLFTKFKFVLNDDLSLSRRLTLILRRSRTGTVWFYTSTSNKRAAQPKLYKKSLTRDLKLLYSRLTLVRISINL